MNKKVLLLVAGILVGLVVIILVAIVILENKNPKVSMTFSNVTKNTVESPKNEENVINNEIKNEIEEPDDPKKEINGEITEVETEDGGKIPVPPTFKYIEGESSKGAVIADEDGNEFVWVPVPEFNNYQRQLFLNNGEYENSFETLEEATYQEINDYNENFDDSIRNYGGFYIARYEAGKDDNKLVSQKDKLVYTGVRWSEARDLSLKMYDSNDYFETDLVNSYAWDTICNWLRNTENNIDNSTEYGNYADNINHQDSVVLTGSNENWKTNNIYDMAGNAWEYTTEEVGEYEKVHTGRGGGYWNQGNQYPISARLPSDNDEATLYVGFRVVMYLK